MLFVGGTEFPPNALAIRKSERDLVQRRENVYTSGFEYVYLYMCVCVTINRNPLQSLFRRPSGREQARSTLEQDPMLQNVALSVHVNLPRWLMVLIEAV